MDNVKGMPGFIQGGDRIDVWASFDAVAGGASKQVVKLLLPNVMVLAAPKAGQSSYFVLRVAGRDIGRLAYAAEHADLRFVVRPSGNAKPVPLKPFTQEDLLFGKGKG
jgi:Flp pilus assembly protein CpaB